MKMSKGTHRKIRFLDGLFYVLFVAIIGMLGYVAQKYQYQADWTFGNRNSLSPTTVQILKKLQQPLTFAAYVPDDAAIRSEIRKRLVRYQKYKPDTVIEMVNPELEPERAREDGIRYQGQVLVRLGERAEVIESLSESTIANVLQRLSRSGDNMVVFLEGHDERDPFSRKSSGMSRLTDVLKKRGFRIQPHNLVRTQSLPVNTQLLVIASPQKDLLPGEATIIVNYLQQGGNLLWLHEPGSLHGLEPVEAELGLLIDEGTLVDANQQLRDLLGIKHPAVVPVVDYNGAEISKNLNTQTLFPFATAINRDESQQNDWHYEDFLLSLPTSWLEVDKLEGNVSFDEEAGDKPGPLPIGVSMTRQSSQSSEEGAETDTSSPGKQQRAVVVGDSDFMLNAFVGQVGNMDLSIAIFNWLVEDDALLDVKARNAPDTRLDIKPAWLYSIGMLFLIVLPLLFVLMGLVIWYRRRKR